MRDHLRDHLLSQVDNQLGDLVKDLRTNQLVNRHQSLRVNQQDSQLGNHFVNPPHSPREVQVLSLLGIQHRNHLCNHLKCRQFSRRVIHRCSHHLILQNSLLCNLLYNRPQGRV
jgi:hypothetical protein